MDAPPPATFDRVILPHRSYRTLTRPRGAAAVAVVCGLGGAALMWWFAGSIANAITPLLARALGALGVGVTMQSDSFLRYDLRALHFAMPSHSWHDLLWWIVGCIVVCVAAWLLRPLYPPLRYFLILNAVIVGGEATYLYFTGHLGYDSDDFSALLLHTAIVTWIVVPPFVCTFAGLFPFEPLEIVAVTLCAVVYEIVLSMVRYGAFVDLLSHSGPIMMADLYLQFGPLFDVIPLIGLLTLFLVPLAKRKRADAEGWVWL
jgi:hypothetical protein